MGLVMTVTLKYQCNLVTIEPRNYMEAIGVQGWEAAMKEEINMINKNETWQLVERPLEQKVLGVRWVYRTKLN